MDKSAPSLAWALLLTGLAYALPITLFPLTHPAYPTFGKGILNLYCVVAWFGFAHFIYAFRGQFIAACKPQFPRYQLIGAMILGALGLVVCRHLMGWMLFSFVMWVYFIPHFIHALVHFNQAEQKDSLDIKVVTYWFPTLSFAVFTFALFGLPYLPLPWQVWILMVIIFVCMGAGWIGGVFSQLRNRQLSSIILLAFVLLAEAMVWGAYSPFMHPQFRQGIYIMHVAMASFYHYFRSYAFAREKAVNSRWLSLASIISVNVCVMALGYMVLQVPDLSCFQVLGGITWFTFWVGLHQYASDVFNLLRRKVLS